MPSIKELERAWWDYSMDRQELAEELHKILSRSIDMSRVSVGEISDMLGVSNPRQVVVAVTNRELERIKVKVSYEQ